MKRKIALILLSVLLAFALTACGQVAPEPDVLDEPRVGAEDTVSSAAPETDDAQPVSDAPEEAESEPAASKALVAYFSRAGENCGVGVIEKGNAEIVAEMIADEVGADTFRIQTVNAYPESYDECTEAARQERDQGARPELTSTVANMDDYDVVYLGYPIWYGDMPMAVYTFLESCDLTGKTIVPFCTHAGSDLADTVSSIQTACSGATVLDGLAIAGITAQNDRDAAQRLVTEFLKAD